jgi:hypothetical protein
MGGGDHGPRGHSSIYAVMRGNTSQTAPSTPAWVGGTVELVRTALSTLLCGVRPRRQSHPGQHGGKNRGSRERNSIYTVMRGKTSQTAPSVPAWVGGPWTLHAQLYLRQHAGTDLADNPSRTAWGGTMDFADTALSTLLCGERPRRQLHLWQHRGEDNGPANTTLCTRMCGKTSQTAPSMPAWGHGPWTSRTQIYLRCYAG